MNPCGFNSPPLAAGRFIGTSLSRGCRASRRRLKEAMIQFTRITLHKEKSWLLLSVIDLARNEFAMSLTAHPRTSK